MISSRKLLIAVLIVINLTLTSAVASDSKQLIVVASPMSIEATDIDYTGLIKSNAITVGFGSALKLKYEIDEIIYGAFKNNEVTFYDFERTGGFPSYVTEGLLYLFLVKENDNYILSNIGTLKSSGDDLIICGRMLNPYAGDNSPIAPKYLESQVCENSVKLEDLKLYFSKFDFKRHNYKKSTMLKK